MVHASALYTIFAAALAAGNPIVARAVEKLNDDSFKEAQQRDETATRALSNVQIKTSDGKCLFVDALSGDFRANLTPLQIGDCSSGNGQGFDVITKGKHNDQQGQALIVSTLTNACVSFDSRRPADSQVHLFSCGGRADGGGEVTDSQLFAFDGSVHNVALTPANTLGKCLVADGDKVAIANCNTMDAKQSFTFSGEAGKGSNDGSKSGDNPSQSNDGEQPSSSGAMQTSMQTTMPTTDILTSIPARVVQRPDSSPMPSYEGDGGFECNVNIVTVVNTVTVTLAPPEGMGYATSMSYSTIYPTETSLPGNKVVDTTSDNTYMEASTTTTNDMTTTTTRADNTRYTTNPTEDVPVSRAGTKLNPTAAAEANEFDKTARRALESVNIRAADGRCLAIDPTAGDFRQNLIPVTLATCSEEADQKFDVVTEGKHNDARDSKALLVSVLTNGCLSFDSRRQSGDTVTLFSCGGRAGGGKIFSIFAKLYYKALLYVTVVWMLTAYRGPDRQCPTVPL